jgi:hypothetical protein
MANYLRLLGLFLLAAFLLFMKSPDAILAPQFWAEDGPIFFVTQLHQALPQLLMPYAGYLHEVPRLVAWVANQFDFANAPLIYNSAAIAIDAACITYVSVRLRQWLPQWAVFFSFLVVPAAGDIFGTITNVQWFMQFVLATACFVPANEGAKAPLALRIVGYMALALAGLSGPFSVIIMGIAIFAMLLTLLPVPSGRLPLGSVWNIVMAMADTGRRMNKTAILIVAACACIQILVMLIFKVYTPASLHALTFAEQVHIGVEGLHSFYVYTVNRPFSRFHIAELMMMAVIAMAYLIDAIRRPGTTAGLGCLLIIFGIAQPILAYAKQRELHTLAASSHYFYMLSVVLCWVGWRTLNERIPSARAPAIAALAVALMTGIAVQPNYFRRQPLHDLAWGRFVDQIRTGRPSPIVVPLNPLPWGFKLITL